MKIKEMSIQASDISTVVKTGKYKMRLRHDGKVYEHAGNTKDGDIRKYIKEDTGFVAKLVLVTNPFWTNGRTGEILSSPREDKGVRAVWVWSG